MRNLYISQFLIELYVDSILHACKNEPTHTHNDAFHMHWNK